MHGSHRRRTLPSVLPRVFPSRWATTYGEDGAGIIQVLSLDHPPNPLSIVFRWIAPGRFTMGSPPSEVSRFEDEAQHEVLIDEGFWMADVVCTQDLWGAVQDRERRRSPHRTPAGKGPVVSGYPQTEVSWHDITGSFLPALEQLAGPGVGFALPSEAQWEFACRAGSVTPYAFGMNLDIELCNCDWNFPYGGDETRHRTGVRPVRSYPSNDWGLYDMHGNVWEWCDNAYRAVSGEPPSSAGAQTPADELGVTRGGCWFNEPSRCRSATRLAMDRSVRDRSIGFRLCCPDG